ncbi:MAG: MATE family efflux transporter [Pyrinomonadaceae bacterium]
MEDAAILDSDFDDAALAIPASKKAPPKLDRSIVEGPLTRAVWKIAWPSILANLVSGLQGMVDHVLVGRLIGYKANAAIGVSWQIFLVVIVFISSVFIGMSVLVARFAGANEREKVNRTVYQGFLTAMFISLGILAPIGYFCAPLLLRLVRADAGVTAQALPYLRIMFVGSGGLLIYFLLAGALRSAGDSRTPMILGVAMTVLNLVFNIILIRGLGPIPAFGTSGSALGTCIATGLVGAYSIWRLVRGGWVVSFPKGGYAPNWRIIRQLFKFGLPAGIQGVAMNVGGVLMFYFMGTLAEASAAQASFSVAYGQLFLLVTWSSNALMGASAAVAGQNLGAGNPERARDAVYTAARIGLTGATFVGIFFFFFPHQLLGIFGMKDPAVVEIGVQLLRVLSVSGLFISTALAFTGGLQGTGDTKGPLYISLISQVVLPLGSCFVISMLTTLRPLHIWLAILAGHLTRCLLSFLRFQQGKWQSINVDIEHTKA